MASKTEAPKGHARSVRVVTGLKPKVVIYCECGWRSALKPREEAEADYDQHLLEPV